jgi:hypothetical protein
MASSSSSPSASQLATAAPTTHSIELTSTRAAASPVKHSPSAAKAATDEDGSGGEWSGSDSDYALEHDEERGLTRPPTSGSSNKKKPSKRSLKKRASSVVRRTRRRAGNGCAAVRAALGRIVEVPMRPLRALGVLASASFERRFPSTHRHISLLHSKFQAQCGPITPAKLFAIWLIKLLVVSSIYWTMQGNGMGMIDGVAGGGVGGELTGEERVMILKAANSEHPPQVLLLGDGELLSEQNQEYEEITAEADASTGAGSDGDEGEGEEPAD